MNSNKSHKGRLFAALMAFGLTGWSIPAAQQFDRGAIDTDLDELSLVIRCTNSDLKAGDEIPIEFLITNRGTNDYNFSDRSYDRSGRMPEYQLTAKTELGDSIPDPRAGHDIFWEGGGLFAPRILRPGESASRVIPLNRWALVTNSGRYVVVGTFSGDPYRKIKAGAPVISAPITISIAPRSEKEMNAYIDGLARQIARLPPSQRNNLSGRPGPEQDALVMKLMYTCNPRIVPTLLETIAEPGNVGPWEREALMFYVLPAEQTKRTIVKGVNKFLAPDNAAEWAPGVTLAQIYGDDSFTNPLLYIATHAGGMLRQNAILALALNRTDKNLNALKKLLKDPDPEVRHLTENSIRAAYIRRVVSHGEPLKPDDFAAIYETVRR